MVRKTDAPDVSKSPFRRKEEDAQRAGTQRLQHDFGVRFFGIDVQVLDGFGKDGLVELNFFDEGRQRGEDGEFGVHFEEAAKAFAGVAAAKAVGAKAMKADQTASRRFFSFDRANLRSNPGLGWH